MQALDAKSLAPERLDMEASLGEKSAGYRWLAVALAADAVKYAQGDQLVATSDNNKFTVTALSAKKTRLPENVEWGNTVLPVMHGAMVWVFFLLSCLFYRTSFTPPTEHLSVPWLVASISIPAIISIGTGFALTMYAASKAYEDMGW